ncbi:MAG: efflux RND transporter permease subunit, partial [candidate division Zixibacteria bacterium]
MNPFFRFFAERHILANIVTLMSILLGISALMTIKRDIWPQVEYGVMVITTRYPGASPEDVELNVTNKIEEELKAVAGIDRISSVSMENISVITLALDPDYSDQDEVKSDVEEAVGRVTELPAEVTESPLVTDIKTSIFPVIEVGLAGELPYRELRTAARRLKTKLEDVSGVGSVKKFGYLAREIKVEVSPEAVAEYQIPLREIIMAVQSRNIRSTAGSFESYTSEKNLVTLAQFRDPLEVGNVIVRSSFDGPSVKLSDLAIVSDEFEDERVLSRMNGHQAISFQINKKQSADAIRTVDAVKRVLAEEAEILPEGTEVLFSNDFSRYVRNRFDVVRANGIIGLILVVVVLSLFLNIRSAFWVAMGIPVTLLAVIFLMPAFGAYLDSVSLAAMIIVIGIIVDDGIIIAENVQRHRERGQSPLEAATTGIQEVFAPVLTTILTTFLAFAPMFFMTGIMGNFIFVIPLIITLALGVSLIEAVVALPAHLVMGLKHDKAGKQVKSNWFRHFIDPYKRYTMKFLRLRYLFVVIFLGLLSSSLWYAANFMQFELFPSSMAEQFNILVELPIGSSLQSTADRIHVVEELVADLPEEEVASFITRIGTQEVLPAAGYPPGENENWAFISINLSPYTERSRTADEIVEALRATTDTMSQFERISYAVEAGGPPVGKPITIRVVGADDSLRTALADSVALYLATLPGTQDIDRNDKPGKQQISIDINYDRLARLGLTVADVAQNVRIAYDGEVVTSVRYADEDVDFRVMLQAEARKNPEYLSHLLIPNRQGRMIPLSQVASFHTGPGPSNFYHFDYERAITVSSGLDKDKASALATTENVVQHFNLDRDWPEMRFEIGGEAQETEKSMVSLAIAFLLANIGIYFLLTLLFNSPTQPIVVMAAIPFGIMGVIVAFAVHGQALGFVAMMGVIGLVGVLV